MSNEKDVITDVLIGISSSGTKDYYPIKYKYDENVKCFVPYFDKPINMYEKIQASKSSVDITTIVQRATMGDITVLNVNKPTYADVSNIPDNLNDLNKFNLESLNSFAKLDPSLKVLFDNDVHKFLNAVQDGTYIDVIQKGLAPKVEQKEDKKDGE